MPIRQTYIPPEGGMHPIKIWTDEVENSARVQLENLSRLPFIHKHIAAMPDVHAGYGSTVGSVIATVRAIIPASDAA
jgi:tRNA-splicing ligase RtcB